MRETEETRSIKLEAIKDKLESPDLSVGETKRLLKLQHHLEHRKFLFRRTKLNMAISLALIVCVSFALVLAYSPATSVTSSNLVVLNGSGKLMNYDGTGITISNLDDIEFIGLQNNQVLGYNDTSGLWQNMNQTGTVGGDAYAFNNLTDVAFVGLANGDIPVYNSGSGKWVNSQPFTASWNNTVNQLIGLSSIAWSQIINGDSTVNSLIATYISSNPPSFSTLTNVPSIGAYNFLIQANDPIAGNYSARYPNGTIAFTSTNYVTTIDSAWKSCSPGQVIALAPGIYNQASGLIESIPIALIGSGQAIINITATMNAPIQVGNLTYISNNCTFSNLIFNLNNMTTGAGILYYGNNGLFSHNTLSNPSKPQTPKECGFMILGNQTRIQNNRLINIACYGIYVDGGIDLQPSSMLIQDVWITGNYLENIYYNAIANYGVEQFSITNNIINGSGHSAIACSPARYGIITGNSVNNVSRYVGDGIGDGIEGGIEVETGHYNGFDNSTHDISVMGNFVCNSTAGIIVRSNVGVPTIQGVNIIGNSVSNNIYYGIYLYRTQYCDISKNIIMNTTLVGASYNVYGILLNTNCSYNSISGNTVAFSSVYGLYLSSSASNNYIESNKVFDNGIASSGGQIGIAIYSNNNWISSNQVYDDRTGAARTQSYGIFIYADYSPYGNILQNNNVFNSATSDITLNGYCAMPNGNILTQPIGAAVTSGQILYSNSGTYYLANSVSTSAMNAVTLTIQNVTSGSCQMITQGYYNNPNWAWTVGGSLYVSNSTAGAFTQTLPATSGNIDQYVGYAVSATEIYFSPNAITIGR